MPGAQTTTTTNAPPENPAVLDPAPAPAEPTSLLGNAEPEKELVALDKLEVPEGLSLTDEKGEPLPEAAEFLDLVNEAGLPAEAANKFLATHHKLLTTAFEAAVRDHSQQWEQLQEGWQNEVRALPDFAGDRFQPSMAKIAKVLDKYGSKEARDAFTVTGAGNNPHIVQMLKKMADDLVEAAAPVSGQPSPGTAKDRAQRMFGST